MAKAPSAAGNQGDNGPQTATAQPEPTAHTGPRGMQDLNALLLDLDPDARVSVTRIAPAYAEGWLDDVRVSTGQEDELLAVIRKNYGGGTFRVQLRRARANGGRVFAAGTAIVTIAGEPSLRGRRYLPDGSLESPGVLQAPPVAAAAPTPYLGSLGSGSPMELLQAVAALLEHRQQPAAPGAPPQPLGDVAQLIRALRPEVVPPQTDPFGSLDRTLTLLAKMRTVFADDGNRSSKDETEEGFGGIGGIEGKFLSMMMAQQGGGQPQQPAGQWVWHPQHGQHVWMPTPPASYRPPASQAPPVAPQPQASAQSPTQEPHTEAQPNPDDEYEDDDEPYTVDDVLEGIRGLSPAEQMELLSRVGDVLPAEIGAQVQAQAGRLIEMKGVGHG